MGPVLRVSYASMSPQKGSGAITSEVMESRERACHAEQMQSTTDLGDHLRRWRKRRNLSQLGLSGEAEISARHLSFIETGRSVPSREMVLRLSEALDVPLRERNAMLLAAGYAPQYRESRLEDPALQAARRAIDLVLEGQEPNPALAFDRHWTLVSGNKAYSWLVSSVDADLLRPPVNVLRLALHPRGLAPRILNLAEYRPYALRRLRRQLEASGDPVIADLLREFSGYPAPGGHADSRAAAEEPYSGLVVRFQIECEGATLSFFTTSTLFGAPLDLTLSELAIESLFPANEQTVGVLRKKQGLGD